MLARAGHDVTVYEEAADPRSIGAGILLQPTGMEALEQLGLADAVAARGSAVRSLLAVTPAGRRVLDLSYAQLSPELCGVGLHRGVLFQQLYQAVIDSGVEVRTGCAIVDVTPVSDGKRSFVDATGRTRGPHDLLIAADGARSGLRAAGGIRHRVRPYAWGALWCIVPDRERVAGDRLYQVVRGTEAMVGLLPTGLGPPEREGARIGHADDVTGGGSHDDPPPLATIYWSIRLDRLDAWQAAPLSQWKDDVRRLMPETEGLLRDVTEHAQVLPARYCDVRMSRWIDDGLIYLGDAAHATSPQLGQGSNAALMDAVMLGHGVTIASTKRPADVNDALRLWAGVRRSTIRYYQWAARWLTPWFQSDSSMRGRLRDVVLPVLCRTPYVRMRMIRTMAGLERGLFQSPRAMPDVDETTAEQAD